MDIFIFLVMEKEYLKADCSGFSSSEMLIEFFHLQLDM